jgi:hypothetical protein
MMSLLQEDGLVLEDQRHAPLPRLEDGTVDDELLAGL